MRSDAIFPNMIILGLSISVVFAQETPPPEKPKAAPQKKVPKIAPQNRFIEQQFRQLRGEIEQIKEAYTLQLNRSVALDKQVTQLQTANRELKREIERKLNNNEDIDELARKLKELDKNRRNDLAITNKQIDEILKIIKNLATSPVQPRGGDGGNNPAPANFKFRVHPVQAGEFLSTIQEAYNDAFKKEGLKGRVTQSQILKANPGLNPNRLLIGQKLRIPLPGQIK